MENILIVVSDRQLLEDLSDCCRSEGFTPHSLTEGSYVLPWISERGPTAIILDTGAEGVDTATLCRGITASSSAQLFVLTQGDSEADQLKAEGLDVKIFFSKPLESALVLSQVKSLLS